MTAPDRAADGLADARTLPVVRASELDEPRAERHWLIETLWARAGVGVIGGAPKSCKSWLGLDLALSVASATPCLDTFAVHDPGPVLLYLAEDDPASLKARLTGLCRHRGLDLAALPLHVITAPTLRLDLEDDQRRLYHTVAQLGPRLVLLDPFVRLHRLDENHARDVAALLAYLRALQRTFDLAVAVVHHVRKNGRAGPLGQNLRGSGDFHAWYDSSLYLHRQSEALLLTPEHRAAAQPPSLRLRLQVGDPADAIHLEVLGAPPAAAEAGVAHADLDAAVLAALAPAPLTRTQLRAALRVRNERLGPVLDRLATRGRIRRHDDRWTIPIPTPRVHPERNGASPDRQGALL